MTVRMTHKASEVSNSIVFSFKMISFKKSQQSPSARYTEKVFGLFRLFTGVCMCVYEDTHTSATENLRNRRKYDNSNFFGLII